MVANQTHFPLQPAETAERKNKTGFVNYKGIVWHDAIRVLIEDIAKQPPEGIPIKCADDVVRFFVLSMMALTRGGRGNFPCPQCLVPQGLQSDLSIKHEERDVVKMYDSVRSAVIGTGGHRPTAEQREQILSAVSLRPVGNVFWTIPHSGPYPAFAFDTLHFIWAGLAEHLSEQLKAHIKQIPGQARGMTVKVNKQVDAIPRWRDLHHMDNFMDENFNDGSKHEDACKAITIGMHGVFSPSSPELCISAGYQLLRAHRYYVETAMFACMDVVTESRSDAGRQRLSKFHKQLKSYQQLVEDDPILGSKGWNFPKLHLHVHLFDNIWDKGVTRVQSTKPFEKIHGPIRKIYLEQTNFKNIPRQILDIIHRHSIAKIIRDDIDRLDESTAEEKESARTSIVDNIRIGSPDPSITFDALEQLMSGDRAFTNFRVRLQNSLHRILPLFFGVESRPGRSLAAFSGGDKIRPFKYLQVEYPSEVDWRLTCDYLRCNPNFHHRPRYDCVLLRPQDVLDLRGRGPRSKSNHGNRHICVTVTVRYDHVPPSQAWLHSDCAWKQAVYMVLQQCQMAVHPLFPRIKNYAPRLIDTSAPASAWCDVQRDAGIELIVQQQQELRRQNEELKALAEDLHRREAEVLFREESLLGRADNSAGRYFQEELRQRDELLVWQMQEEEWRQLGHPVDLIKFVCVICVVRMDRLFFNQCIVGWDDGLYSQLSSRSSSVPRAGASEHEACVCASTTSRPLPPPPPMQWAVALGVCRRHRAHCRAQSSVVDFALNFSARVVDASVAGIAVAVRARGYHSERGVGLIEENKSVHQLMGNYRHSLDNGILKVMLKMGIDEIASYKGAQIFEILGLHSQVVQRCFTRTASHVQSAASDLFALESFELHEHGWPSRYTEIPPGMPESGKSHWRDGGEPPTTTRQALRTLKGAPAAPFPATEAEDKQPAPTARPTHKVTASLTISKERYVPRTGGFSQPTQAQLAQQKPPVERKVTAPAPNKPGWGRTGAAPPPRQRPVSTTAISKAAETAAKPDPRQRVDTICEKKQSAFDAYICNANVQTKCVHLRSLLEFKYENVKLTPIAQVKPWNKIGGEDAEWSNVLPTSDTVHSALKQVVSGRFSLTSHHLADADELQIRLAQGAKPGEGGELLGCKISRTHHSTCANPRAHVSVKPVSDIGVGIVASGVAKAKVCKILILGHSDGTGAARWSNKDSKGLPWELGLAETRQTLVLNGLCSRVTRADMWSNPYQTQHHDYVHARRALFNIIHQRNRKALKR
ncbi:hypothetical protein HDZ31DRAFT_76116 [Schizophyllum fasciatum]